MFSININLFQVREKIVKKKKNGGVKKTIMRMIKKEITNIVEYIAEFIIITNQIIIKLNFFSF